MYRPGMGSLALRSAADAREATSSTISNFMSAKNRHKAIKNTHRRLISRVSGGGVGRGAPFVLNSRDFDLYSLYIITVVLVSAALVSLVSMIIVMPR